MRLDCIRVIETGYAPATTEAGWLGDLVDTLEPLDAGCGVMVSAFEIGGLHPGVRDSVASAAMAPDTAQAFREFFGFTARAPAQVRQLLFAPPPCVCRSNRRTARLAETDREQIHRIFAGTGIRDSLGVAAVEPGGDGLLVSVPSRQEVSMAPQSVHQLSLVAAHLCSALRLRTRAGGQAADLDGDLPLDVEAVLDPSGRVEHATGEAAGREARASLAAAVRRVEQARGRLRRSDPDQALAIWLALFEGRWSIVESSESDGRRWLLARRNQPGVQDPKSLAPAERHVLAFAAMGHSNKFIGYTLGVAPSTVSTRLSSALRKLGLRSRREAIELFGGLASPPQQPA